MLHSIYKPREGLLNKHHYLNRYLFYYVAAFRLLTFYTLKPVVFSQRFPMMVFLHLYLYQWLAPWLALDNIE